MGTGFFAWLGENFALLLLIATIATAIVSLVDKFCFEKKRRVLVEGENPEFQSLPKKKRRELLKGPLLADYCRSLFPVFLIVLILRSFIGEPFKVPSGSMLPTIQIGDYFLVNKFAYGIRFPVWDKVLIPIGKPKRGDVVIVHYPVDTKVDFIKRVIGVPGDRISYQDRKLTVNGKPVPTQFVANVMEPNDSETRPVKEFQETMGGKTHNVFHMPWRQSWNFKDLVVPKGMYFLMGDNRDNSEDSRFWGFAPASYLVGKPEVIFFSWDSRNHDVRWGRLGTWLN